MSCRPVPAVNKEVGYRSLLNRVVVCISNGPQAIAAQPAARASAKVLRNDGFRWELLLQIHVIERQSQIWRRP